MKNLNELSISDLKTLFDYFTLLINDAIDNGKVINEDVIIETEPKLTAVNNELQKRINNIKF
jgi:hypothetical protein